MPASWPGAAGLRPKAPRLRAAGLLTPPSASPSLCRTQTMPAEDLIRRSRSAELLVIGARCHPGHGHLLGGDVVPHCLCLAACPVDICGGRLTARRAAGGKRARAAVPAGAR